MCDFSSWSRLSRKLISDTVLRCVCVRCTKESEPVAEQHGRAQVVDEVQVREGPSDTVIL